MSTYSAATPRFENCNVVELRQYTLKANRRDTLIDLFDTHFIEPQEAAGVRVLGQFHDMRDPNKFVWIRGFSDMESRRKGLEAFYYGPIWAEHRNAANATMIDSDDVLLLLPAWSQAGLRHPESQRPSVSTSKSRPGRVIVTVFHLREPAHTELLAYARVQLTASLLANRAVEVAWYSTNPAENTFPKLPVREGEQVLVAVARFMDASTFDELRDRDIWSSQRFTLNQWITRSEDIFLEPTGRSMLGE